MGLIKIGFGLVIIGLLLRIMAMRSLGSFWNYHIVRYENQPKIVTGIYKYFSHPAYIGNIFIPGIYLFFGANISAIIATIWIAFFAFYRISIERRFDLCC